MKKSTLFKSVFAVALALSTFSAQAGWGIFETRKAENSALAAATALGTGAAGRAACNRAMEKTLAEGTRMITEKNVARIALDHKNLMQYRLALRGKRVFGGLRWASLPLAGISAYYFAKNNKLDCRLPYFGRAPIK